MHGYYQLSFYRPTTSGGMMKTKREIKAIRDKLSLTKKEIIVIARSYIKNRHKKSERQNEYGLKLLFRHQALGMKDLYSELIKKVNAKYDKN